MLIWRAIQGEGSELGIWPKPRIGLLPLHPWLGQETAESEESGWRRDAENCQGT